MSLLNKSSIIAQHGKGKDFCKITFKRKLFLFNETAFAMHEMLFTKNEISNSIHFLNVDHNNGRKQNIVQKKAVKASKACRKKSSAFKRKTSPYQVRRDLLYYHR